MARIPVLNSPFLLGFDEIERAFDRGARTPSDGYPPYNIERIQGEGQHANRLRITLAVAGFTTDQLDITVAEGQLVVTGRQTEDKNRQFLYRGIASRQFQRVFLLADGMQVAGAGMEDGLLCIELIRPHPSRSVQKIEIKVKD